MAASTCRRSESVRATKGERIPAPRSKPWSATYMANISAAIANHSSNMGALHAGPCDRPERPRTVGDLPSDQEEEQDAERQVEPAEAHEGEEDGPGMNGGARPLGGPEETVDQPGLAAQLGGHPADGVRDVRERKGEHDDPQHGSIGLEPASPGEQDGEESDRGEDGAEARHDVEGVVEELDVVGPDVRRK